MIKVIIYGITHVENILRRAWFEITSEIFGHNSLHIIEFGRIIFDLVREIQFEYRNGASHQKIFDFGHNSNALDQFWQ